MAKKSNKTRILYIITKSVWAGASKYVYDLATNLSQTRFEPMVAAGGQDEMAQKIKQAGIPYFEIKHFQRDINILKEICAFFEILSLLHKTKPDIVHVSSAKAGGVAGITIFIYRLARPLQAVFTVHGWTFNEIRPKWQVILIKLFSKITCLFYDKIICVSEYDYKSAVDNNIAPIKKLAVIHNGIKVDEYKFLSRTESRKKFNLSDSDFVIGTISEFTKNKGHAYLIEAAKNFPNTKFVIIGFGPQKNNYKKQKNVLLIENLPNAPQYLKAFDIFVLPSLKEGLPYVLLEAGLAEIPIIATNVGGVPEIIQNEKTGLLITPANPDELADAIKKLIEDKKFAQNIAQNAKEKILKEFSFEKMLDRTLAAYEEKADS